MPQFDPVPILGPGGAIARRLHRFEERPEQMMMARAVARAIEDESHLMVEAGTGVGKSFAYLVPAILAAASESRQEGRGLDPHHQPPGAAPREGHPALAGGDAAGIHGGPGQGAVELHQPPSARRGITSRAGPDVRQARGVRPARRDQALVGSDAATGAGPTSSSSRSGRSGTPWPASTATAWARSARTIATASTSPPGSG